MTHPYPATAGAHDEEEAHDDKMHFGEKFTAGEMKEIGVIGAWPDEVLWADQCTNPSVQHLIHVVRRRRA